MVNFPEADPKSLPKRELTSLQQKFNASYNEMLVAKRTWKSTQMAFQALASQFKTYLSREFGEDYVETMVKEFRDVDDADGDDSTVSNLNIGSPAFKRGVTLLLGPFAEDIAPPTEPKLPPASTGEASPLFTLYNAQKEQYDLDLADYQESVAVRKTYLGVPKPDAHTCNRMLTLIVKMRDYEKVASIKNSEMVEYATSSLCRGEIPTSALLRTVAKERKLWSSERGVHSSPADWNQFGISSDNPTQWSDDAFYHVLVSSWFTAEATTFKANNTNYQAFKQLRQQGQPTGDLWLMSWQDWNSSKWGVDTRDIVTHAGQPIPKWRVYSTSANGFKLNLSPMLLFYAKAYGKTTDPLTFWATHSKYRLVAEDRGSYGVHVLLSLVDSRFGAQSGQAVTVAVFPPGTATGNAIATMRTYYPYVMDVETGNNPKLDKLIGDSVVTSKIKKAGSTFAKLPPSSKEGMRFIAITTTNLTLPTSIVFSNKFIQSTQDNDFSVYNSQSEEYRLWAYNSPFSPYTSTQKKKMKWDSDPTLLGRSGGWAPSSNFTHRPNFWDGHKEGFDYSKFNWVNWTTKAVDWYSSKGDTADVASGKNTMPSANFINQMLFGWPNPHPDARVITTLDIYLVPEAYELGLSKLYTRLRESTGKLTEANYAGYEGAGLPVKDWYISQQLMILMQSGIPISKGKLLPYPGGTVYDKTGVPFTSQKAFRDQKEVIDLPASNPVAELQAMETMAAEYGLTDFGGISRALSVAVNDVDDIQDIMNDFRQAYPGVSELVYPDAPDEYFTPSAQVLNGVATSFRVRDEAFVLPGTPTPVSGTTIVQRVPINTKGFSGKRYSFSNYMRSGTPIKFSTNELDLLDPSSVTYSTTSNTMFMGGLAIAGMLAYKGLKKAGL